jgi:hypothetical protein
VTGHFRNAPLVCFLVAAVGSSETLPMVDLSDGNVETVRRDTAANLKKLMI